MPTEPHPLRLSRLTTLLSWRGDDDEGDLTVETDEPNPELTRVAEDLERILKSDSVDTATGESSPMLAPWSCSEVRAGRDGLRISLVDPAGTPRTLEVDAGIVAAMLTSTDGVDAFGVDDPLRATAMFLSIDVEEFVGTATTSSAHMKLDRRTGFQPRHDREPPRMKLDPRASFRPRDEWGPARVEMPPPDEPSGAQTEACSGVGSDPVGTSADPVYLSGMFALRYRFGTCPVCLTSVRLDEDGMVGLHKPSFGMTEL